MRTFHLKIFVASVMVAFLIGRSSSAQVLGYLCFKGSHNSYDKTVSITSQIDDWNVWFIEIDICKDDDILKIKHTCGASEYDLDNALQAIKEAKLTQDRLTFVWFDIQVACCDFDDDEPYEVIEPLVSKLNNYFGNEIYRPAEWKQIDGKVWPTYQELMARGKHYIMVFDEDDAKPDDDNLFMSAESYADAIDQERFPAQHIAFINRDGADTDGITINPSDQFLWRSYGLNDPDDWNKATDLGFTLLCMDEIKQSWSFTQVQAPSPLVVNKAATGSEYGTFGNPAHSVYKALSFQNILPGTRLLIHAGFYDESVLLINKKLQIMAIDGTVEIR
jgi:hypothetical protein